MPFVNFISARQEDPDKYKDFRYQKVDGANGLYFVFGLTKKDGDIKAEVQSIRADKEVWNLKDFKKWLKNHDFKTDKIELPVSKSVELFSTFTSVNIQKGSDGDEDDNKIKIGGIISSDIKDQQGDVLLQDGMDWSYFLKRGYFNWEHQQGPENILGVPEKVEMVNIDGKKATKVEGYLLLNTPKAKEVYTAIKAINDSKLDRQIGFSVEGQILERDKLNPKIVKRAKILNVSITAHPVNPDAKLELLARSLMAKEQTESIITKLMDLLAGVSDSDIMDIISILKDRIEEKDAENGEAISEEDAEKAEMNIEGKSKEEIAQMIIEAHPELLDKEVMEMIHNILESRKEDTPDDEEEIEAKSEVGYQTPAQPAANGDISALVPQSIEGKKKDLKQLILEAIKAIEAETPEAESETEVETDDSEYGDMSMTVDTAKTMKDVTQEVLDILDQLGEDYDLPEWIQSKITLALDYIHSSKHYLALRLEEKQALETSKEKEYTDEIADMTEKVMQAFPFMKKEDAYTIACEMMKIYS